MDRPVSHPTLSTSVSPAFMDRFRAIAGSRGLSPSEMLRQAAARSVADTMVGPDGTVPLMLDRDALADVLLDNPAAHLPPIEVDQAAA